MSIDNYEEIREVCSMCNHNRIYHAYFKKIEVLRCTVKGCNCLRPTHNMMRYSQDLLELWR